MLPPPAIFCVCVCYRTFVLPCWACMMRGMLTARSGCDSDVIQTAAFSCDFRRCKSQGTRYLLTHTDTWRKQAADEGKGSQCTPHSCAPLLKTCDRCTVGGGSLRATPTVLHRGGFSAAEHPSPERAASPTSREDTRVRSKRCRNAESAQQDRVRKCYQLTLHRSPEIRPFGTDREIPTSCSQPCQRAFSSCKFHNFTVRVLSIFAV